MIFVRCQDTDLVPVAQGGCREIEKAGNLTDMELLIQANIPPNDLFLHYAIFAVDLQVTLRFIIDEGRNQNGKNIDVPVGSGGAPQPRAAVYDTDLSNFAVQHGLHHGGRYFCLGLCGDERTGGDQYCLSDRQRADRYCTGLCDRRQFDSCIWAADGKIRPTVRLRSVCWALSCLGAWSRCWSGPICLSY